MIRVFLVDDHEIVRRGIAELVDREADLEVVGESSTIARTLGRIQATTPDVVVLDVRLPDGNGIDLCREVLSANANVRCIILTAYDDDEASRAAVFAGASAYVLKDIRAQKLIESIRRVGNGETLLRPDVTRQVMADLAATTGPATAELSLRERQVLDLIAQGMTNRQIGDRLDLAEKTVKNYVSALLAKLGMERRTQAAVFGASVRLPKP